jgi:hypothetical protein
MVNLGTAKLAGVVLVVGILAIAGTNLAFAQNATSPPTSTPSAPTTPPSTPTGTSDYPCTGTPFYGAQSFAYIACTDLGTAQMEGLAITGGVVALAIAFGAAGRQYHTIP